MGDDITIGVTEIVNNIEVTAQPNDQIVDISVIDNADDVTLNITPTVIEINVNKGSSYAKWGTILGTLSDQTDLQNALDLKADLVDGKVPSSQLPSYVDDVIEVANYAALPVIGEIGKIYITLDDNHIFRWTGSIYVEITNNTAVWGAITGTLSSQSDLQSALNAKVPYTGATSNVNLGEYGLTSGYVGFDTTPTGTPSGIGTMYWDTANRTVSLIDGDGDTTLQIGQEERILVHNNTGSTLTDGQVVYVTGSTGELPSVSLANASNESTSATTIGVVTESIANGADGFITTSGLIHGLNTLAFTEGDLLWLGTTAGTYTNTKPTSPNHLVLIGYVIKKAGGNGSILVKIQNTQELDECSDVLFSGLVNNDLLVYETASALWKNKSLATVLGYTPVSPTRTISTTSPLQGGGDLSANRTLSITQASSSTNGYLSSTDWNTFNNKQNALTNPVTGIGTTNYIPKFTGANSLGNSLIYDNGTNVGIGTSSLSALLHLNAGASNDTNIRVQSGAAGNHAKLTFSNSSNTVFWTAGYRSGTGDFGINYGDSFNSTGLTINTSGNVGIGTTSIDATYLPKLHIESSASDGTGGLFIGNYLPTITLKDYSGGSTVSQIQQDGSNLFIKNNGNSITLSSSGYVGIGTTNPVNNLHIQNGSSANTIAMIQSWGTESAGEHAGIRFKSAAIALNEYGKGFIGFRNNGTGYGRGDLYFSLNNSTDTSNAGLTDSKMVITSGGNVLIGTTTDAGYKLDVNGTGRFTGDFAAGGNITSNKADSDSVYLGSQIFLSGTYTGIRSGTDHSFNVDTYNGGSVRNAFKIVQSGAATFSSTVTATGFFNSSDNRLKDLTDYDYNVSDIKPITYLWKDGRDNKKHVGYSAQEVQKIMPDAVNEGTDGMLSVNYVEVLVAQVELLNNRMAEMQKEIELLKSK